MAYAKLLYCLISVQLVLYGAALDVPFVRQTKNGCGAAALAMILQYWSAAGGKADPEADPRAIQKALYNPALKGIRGSAMVRYLEKRGYVAYAITADYDDLQQQLQHGRPVIVCLQPSESTRGLHYVVVLKLDREQQEVLVHDPELGPAERVKFTTFDRSWRATSNWALITTPQR